MNKVYVLVVMLFLCISLNACKHDDKYNEIVEPPLYEFYPKLTNVTITNDVIIDLKECPMQLKTNDVNAIAHLISRIPALPNWRIMHIFKICVIPNTYNFHVYSFVVIVNHTTNCKVYSV